MPGVAGCRWTRGSIAQRWKSSTNRPTWSPGHPQRGQAGRGTAVLLESHHLGAGEQGVADHREAVERQSPVEQVRLDPLCHQCRLTDRHVAHQRRAPARQEPRSRWRAPVPCRVPAATGHRGSPDGPRRRRRSRSSTGPSRRPARAPGRRSKGHRVHRHRGRRASLCHRRPWHHQRCDNVMPCRISMTKRHFWCKRCGHSLIAGQADGPRRRARQHDHPHD